MNTLKDDIVFGSVAGVIGGTVGLIYSYTLFLLGVTPMSSLHLAATLVVVDVLNLTPGAVIDAIITHLLVAAVFGILLTYVLLFTGKDYLVIKGLGTGAVFCLIAHSYLIPLMRTDAQVRNLIFNAASWGAQMSTHALIGLVAAFIIANHHHALKVRSS